jgi:hypothetical protein
MVEMPGGGRLKRPRLKLGCRTEEEDNEEERKKNLDKGNRSPVQTHSYLHNHLG